MTEIPIALVTGFTGWLGKGLIDCLSYGLKDSPELQHLTQNRKIFALIRKGEFVKKMPPNVKVIEGDLLNMSSLREFVKDAKGATLFHTAGIVHPTRGVKEFYDVNVEGTRNLIRVAIDASVRRFIYVSSNSPIGCNPTRDDLFDETAPYHPYLNYGISKMMAEKIVNEANETEKIETVIIRPPWFYGPRQPERQTLFFRMIKEGKVPIVGSGKNLRSMAYIDNICQALLLCENCIQANGKTYWIADERPYTMKEIIDTIEKVMENDFNIACSHKRVHLPNFVSNVAFYIDKTLQNLSLYQQKIHVLGEMNKNIACTIAKAQKELGYRPQIDLEEGMKRSIRWLLDQKISI